MNRRPLRAITEAEVAAYQSDGVVLLKRLFDAGWVERLRGLAEADMATPGPLTQELTKPDESGRFYFNTFMWHRDDGFRDFVFNAPAAEIAARLMDAERVNIVFDQFLIKEPDTPTRTPWHHDLTYWPIDGERVCSLWLALDDVDAESGAVEYVKGSHRWGQRFEAPAFAGDGRYKQGLPAVPDIEARRGELDIIQFAMAPGDCAVHHGQLLHGAPGNARSDRRRRAYVTRWAGDGVVYRPRPNIQQMPWDPDLAPGDALDSDLWPRVWPT